MAYGSIGGVQALTRHQAFGGNNAVTEADVTGWLAARSGELDGWIAAAGYVVPVSNSEARAALDRFANYGAASDVESAQRHGGYTEDDEDRREVWFDRQFRRAKEWIESGALKALGVPLVTPHATGPTSGASRIEVTW